ncbi:hypothetical protein [Methylosinus sp. LW4]|uniref:hypothetical protein n=1 Tax=Methylosinus sp. LW4 TaxID=136993 RepID=UPI00037AE7CD|nr:hypothetical protein [Methylosinus sp. LW4]
MDIGNIDAAQDAIDLGAWIDSPSFPGVAWRVRGSNNADAKRLREKLISAVPRAERLNGLADEARARIEAQVIAETILLDARGLTSGGAPLGIGDVKAQLSTPKRGPLLRADIGAAAALVGEEQLAAVEDDAKNSSAASVGN